MNQHIAVYVVYRLAFISLCYRMPVFPCYNSISGGLQCQMPFHLAQVSFRKYFH